ncbi:protein shisa-5-like [Polymixia lowei]
MAAGLSVVVCLLCVILVPAVSAWDDSCQSYTDISGVYHPFKSCPAYCCGTCNHRYCCSGSFMRLSEDEQDDCIESYRVNHNVTVASSIGAVVIIIIIAICCCVCPCCCLYKMCRKPRPVIATTTHTTVVTTTPQQYPQQPTASPGHPQSYQGAPYPGYQPVPVQPGYGAQPMPTAPYHGQPFTPGPPPPYQEATGPAYPPTSMPYSQAAFSPGQPAYPLQPPAQPQPQAPPQPQPQPQPQAQANAPHPDYLAQPAYNPAYAPPPPKTGY